VGVETLTSPAAVQFIPDSTLEETPLKKTYKEDDEK